MLANIIFLIVTVCHGAYSHSANSQLKNGRKLLEERYAAEAPWHYLGYSSENNKIPRFEIKDKEDSENEATRSLKEDKEIPRFFKKSADELPFFISKKVNDADGELPYFLKKKSSVERTGELPMRFVNKRGNSNLPINFFENKKGTNDFNGKVEKRAMEICKRAIEVCSEKKSLLD